MPSDPVLCISRTSLLASTFEGATGYELLSRNSDDLLESMRNVNVGRRRARRSALLLANRREVNPPNTQLETSTAAAWDNVLLIARKFVSILTPELIRELDELVSQVDDPTSPAGEILMFIAVSGMGFSTVECQWALNELQKSAFEPLQLYSGGEPRVLVSICDAAFSGSLSQIGFVGFTDNEDVNLDVQGAMVRARAVGVTLSVLMLLPAMLLVAAEFGDSTLNRAARSVSDRFALFKPGNGR